MDRAQAVTFSRREMIGMAAGLGLPLFAISHSFSPARGDGVDAPGSPALAVSEFRRPADGADWVPAFNRALVEARRLGLDLEVPAASDVLMLMSAIEIVPDRTGWTPAIRCNSNRFRLGNVGAGFRYRGRKDGAPENPLAGGLRDCEIDYANIGDPQSNSGVRGVYISNGGGRLTFERVRGVNMHFGYHIQNWRYADGGSPGGGITTRDCDCRGAPSSDRSHKWYPFGDQGDLSVDMPGDVVAPGRIAVIATPEDARTSYGAKRPARALLWSNNTGMPVRIPAELSAATLAASGLTQGKGTAEIRGKAINPVTWAYWTSGGTRVADCVVQAETGLIDGADHDGGYYGTMLSGTREYFVNRYRSRNNVRGFAGQNGAKNVHLRGVRIARSLSSAILAGYHAPGWTIDDFEIEASNDRWAGEALINLQLGAAGAVIGRGTIRMGTNHAKGQYAVKIGPNSPNCRIDGPLTITGDCAYAYIAVESAWDLSLSARHSEHYPRMDYRGIASRPMAGISLRNITIEANSVKPSVATAIAIIQASDGSIAEGYHGEIAIPDLVIENVVIASPKHGAYLKFISTGKNRRKPAIRGVTLRDISMPPGRWRSSGVIVLPKQRKSLRCMKNVANLADYCP